MLADLIRGATTAASNTARQQGRSLSDVFNDGITPPATPAAQPQNQETTQPQQQPQSTASTLSGFANMDLSGKIRNQPLSDTYMTQVSSIVRNLGPDIDVRVISGGQDRHGHGDRRTGSVRHDVDEHGVAHTSDFILTRGGRDVRPADDPELYERLFENAAGHFSGAGHYDWGVHLGGGAPAFWGPDTTAATANPRFAEAWMRGSGSASRTAPQSGGNATANSNTQNQNTDYVPTTDGAQLVPTSDPITVAVDEIVAGQNRAAAPDPQRRSLARAVTTDVTAPTAVAPVSTQPTAISPVQQAAPRSVDTATAKGKAASERQYRWLDTFFKTKGT